MKKILWIKGIVIAITILFISMSNTTNINGSMIKNVTKEIINSERNECSISNSFNSTIWFDNFDDGDISDWTIENPYNDGKTKKINISTTTEQSFSPSYSLWISSPYEDWYGGSVKGPDLDIDFILPYSIEFYFYYTDFHWYNLLLFGPIRLMIDFDHLNLVCFNTNGQNDVGNKSFGEYCNKLTWTHFKIDVNPENTSYSIYINNTFVATFNYGLYDTGLKGFSFYDQTGDAPAQYDYIENGYYDDIKITHAYESTFYDNFDDRIRNTNKWIEKYKDGFFNEMNQRVEFTISGGATKTRYEGYESVPFKVYLLKNETFVITWDLFTNISSTSNRNNIILKVNDSYGNWILAGYNRSSYSTYCIDSKKNQKNIIGNNILDGNWTNLLQIFNNGYFVMMGNQYTWIGDNSVFQSGTLSLKVEIYITLKEPDTNRYSQSGFDNIKIRTRSIEWSRPPTPPIITKVDVNSYEFSSTEPDLDTFRYYVDWGDDSDAEYSSELVSGDFTLTHKYIEKGLYKIQAKTTDHTGSESPWTILYIDLTKKSINVFNDDLELNPLTITIPYFNNKPESQLFDRLFQRFPNAFPILRQLMG